MADIAWIFATSLDAIIAVAILFWIIRGTNYFQNGLLVRTLRRLGVVAVLLFLAVYGIRGITASIDYILGTFFMIGLWYTAYAFTNDWRKLNKATFLEK
jgi:hypothetical protein